jgi:hypothetical protein
MGWVYAFKSLNPAVIRELTSLSTEQLRQRLLEGGIAPEDAATGPGEGNLDENEAMALLATTRECDVDKSLDDIRAVAALDPAMAPVLVALREMESFAASQLPERFHSREAGLMGIAMRATIAAAAVAVAPYIGPDGRRALTSTKESLLQRLFGGGVRRRLASDDYLWKRWSDFGLILQHASEHGEWLGLHMA